MRLRGGGVRPMMVRMERRSHRVGQLPNSDRGASSRLAWSLALLVVVGLAGCGQMPAASEPVATDATTRVAEVHLSPTCGCCTEYVAYLRRQGWTVEVVEELDIAAFQDKRGVPDAARGCHTTIVAGYLVEGHVPLTAIEQLLDERPAIDGIGLPGMPAGSPGMTGSATGPLVIVAFDGDEITPFGEY